MQELDKVIASYIGNKNGLDRLKKLCDTQNAQIKAMMTGANLTKYDSGEYIVSKTESVRRKMNEDKLLELLLSRIPVGQLEEQGIIKRIWQIDLEKLENAIYDGIIANDVVAGMRECEDNSTVVTLKISKRRDD